MEAHNGSFFLRGAALRRSVLTVIAASMLACSGSTFAWTRPQATVGLVTELHTNAVAPRSDAMRASYVEGEVLVRYRAVASSGDRRDMLSRLGASEMRHLSPLRLVQVRIAASLTVEQAVRAYAADPLVEHIQPNYIYRPLAVPSDPLFSQQWGYRNTGQTVSGASYSINNPGVAGSDMSLEQAWDHITDCSGVVVAVIDTGVNYLHQDLAPNMWDGSGAGYPYHGYDFIDNDDDPMPGDASGHGTHVAATIGAAGNNGVAVSGVCWNSRIMAIRSLSETVGTTASVVAGINFAIDRGAHVINMSLGGTVFDQVFSDAVSAAQNAGIVVVVAAGNDGTNNDTTTPHYPCNFTQPNLLCVTALDQAYNRASFGNTGSTSVDVGAPGTNVLSAFPGPETSEDFSSGWTLGGAWTRVNCAPVLGLSATPMLVNPANWCSNGTYANNANDVAYKSFDFSGAIAFNVTFYTVVNLEQNVDFMGFAYRGAGGDPFVNGSPPFEFSNESSARGWVWSAPPAECGTATCSLGIRLRSNATTVARGIGVFWASVSTAVANSTHTYVASGTSMASPHAAGVAAMVRAYNPNYTYADTLEAIKQGGRNVSALFGVTVTGRAVDAMGALRYIRPPTGLSATVQQ